MMLKKFTVVALAVFASMSLSAGAARACMDEEGGCAAKADVRAAIEKGDFAAFQKATAEIKCPSKDKITAENFPRLMEAHRLMKEGKKDEARAIKAELGLDGKESGCPHHAAMSKGKGEHKGHGKGHKCPGNCKHHQ